MDGPCKIFHLQIMCGIICGVLKFLRGFLVFTVIFIYQTVKCCIPDFCKRKKSLCGKIILITGSGSGIGRELAIQLAEFRPILILWSRLDTTNLETERLIREKYKRFGNELKIFVQTCDVGNWQRVKFLAEKVKVEIGTVDILINNAGIIHGEMLCDLSPEAIQKTINTNLMSHFWTLKEFLPAMLDRNSGHIVAMSSVAGIVGSSQITDYSATKFGIIGLMESLEIELRNMGKQNVKVTTVCPYFVNTGMFAGVRTNFHGVLPILSTKYVASKTVGAIRMEKQLLYIPRMLYVILATKGYFSQANKHNSASNQAFLAKLEI